MLKELKQSILNNSTIDTRNMSTEQFLTHVILLIHTHPDLEFEKVKPYLIEFFNGSPKAPTNKDHPINILVKHQQRFSKHIKVIESLLEDYANNQQDISFYLNALKNINNYFNVKEKLLFPLLERYGQYQLPRRIWEMDDYLRVSLQAMQKRVEKLESVHPRHIHSTFREIQTTFNYLKDSEQYILYPLCDALFTEENWQQVAREATAFHFDMLDYVENEEVINPSQNLDDKIQHPFGNGFLTMKEVNLILNSLPLELTFIDERGIFKYFNHIVEAQDMLFIRTPLSIGRHVANCHPPRSLKNMMKVIRLLKSREEEQVAMWFKRGEVFIHVTYVAVFDEDDTFKGVLEYVQDINPYVELPRATKKHV
ncbi:PAS domain-containing protein [Aliicoccus persicus]|uniref:PAS domain-containing protein n=1 Tax=Aliicoccus persicus TaxID=930138 RepID=A0A662Z4M8_9STAP|nr:PAS domain-containing protein [Aliicoccus persicus]SEW02691.1 hypothetical protein SAMN05192557_1314 [Aliicoccus persicus]HJE20453.1 PAS domain-containing protein [Aliicoccus persicus]